MKILLRLAIAVVLPLSLTPALAKELHAKRPLAKSSLAWTGLGTQTQRGMQPSYWRIKLVFDRAGNARIDYPSLHCGGALTRLGQAGNVTKFREHIRYGRTTCIDNGTVTTWRRGNRLMWRWTGELTREPAIKAKATLVLSRHRGR
jgi:hypothetical protein